MVRSRTDYREAQLVCTEDTNLPFRLSQAAAYESSMLDLVRAFKLAAMFMTKRREVLSG
jgi:hypothetical protein